MIPSKNTLVSATLGTPIAIVGFWLPSVFGYEVTASSEVIAAAGSLIGAAVGWAAEVQLCSRILAKLLGPPV